MHDRMGRKWQFFLVNPICGVDNGYFARLPENDFAPKTLDMTDLPDNFGRRVGAIEDLPAKLRDQLQLGKVADLDQAIINLIRDDLDGIANLDEILVGLYRKRGDVFERHFVSNKLYLMNKLGLIRSVQGRKGVYETAT